MQSIKKPIFALVLALAAATGGTSAWAGGFENIVLSSEQDAEETKDSFAADTAQIFISADITDEVSSGSKITVAWVALDTAGVAPANYKIDEATFDVGAIDNQLDASLSKPNNGFPVGSYQVQISVDGKPAENVNFTVK
ncbi:hypothetical protein HHL25_02205 [Rhizobium sp. S-51]|uniref:Uncharacterized protein n=1 Tax=Rhizobium terricola TaxID=2728849 RepID=A0A7Y0FUJ5_9HYPH|nr:hypothetical protein [Rhizobium terricola]NML72930.1 hypothetical protein [Rhizobium terricola]